MGKDVIIKYKNKKTNTVYVYYGHSEYDKNGKCTTKGVRKLIGKYNVQDEFEPNMTFLKMSAEEQMATGLVEEPYYPYHQKETSAESSEHSEKFYGLTSVIEAQAKETGLYGALKKVFPNDYLSMMSMVESLMCYSNRPLYSPKRFHSTCWHTNMDMLSEDSITKALEAVDSTNRERFFTAFNESRKNCGETVVALDTTSISTYSSMLHLAKYGHNKEGDSLPQINLLMVCDSKTGIPLHYRNVSGNESDMVSVKASVENMKNEGVSKGTVFSMDRGFCSISNMQLILKNGFTFLMCMPEKCEFYNQAVDAVLPSIEDTANYHESIERYCSTYDVEIPVLRRGRGKNSYTMTVYVFRDLKAHAEQKENLTEKFMRGLSSLQANPSLYTPKSFYEKYYKKDGETFTHNTEAQNKAKERCGLFLVIGPKGWNAEKVHYTYKQRDMIEKDYENWKVKMRRPRHSLDEHLEGKVFIIFLTTIIESAIRRILHKQMLDTRASMEDNIDIIFNAKWRKPEGKKFKDGNWIDLTLEQTKMLYILGVPGMEAFNSNIANLVKNDLLHRQGKFAKRGRKSQSEAS